MNALNAQQRGSDELTAEYIVHAVIVSYNPDLPRVAALIASLQEQVAEVIVVDNGSQADVLAALRQHAEAGGIKLIEFGENRGIATAHNAGIRYALERAATHVMLFDHDSVLEPRCVENLLSAAERLQASGVRIGAVGPQYHDDTSAKRAPFIRFNGLRFTRVYARDDSDVVEANVLISSGCLISREVLAVVGLMDERLFIEGVDWEWCMRASARGYRLYGVAAAKMLHTLGDSGIHILGRVLPLHSPLRHYYVFRNTVVMNRMAHVAFAWKLNFSLRLVVRFGVYMLFAPHRIERCRMIARGICDGLRGRSGAYRQDRHNHGDKPVSVR